MLRRALQRHVLSGVLLVLLACCGGGCAVQGAHADEHGLLTAAEAAYFARWEDNMRSWGAHWGEFQNPQAGHSWDQRVANAYYDQLWNMYRIRDYLGEREPWSKYIAWARRTYRDQYYRRDHYDIPGYRRFAYGLLADYLHGGDTRRADLRAIRDKPAFSRLEEYVGQYDGKSQSMSREVAYALQANLAAERAGEPRQGRRVAQFVRWMEHHLYEWRYQDFSGPAFFQPFMLGLTAEALIDFVEWERQNGRDPDALWPKAHWASISLALGDLAHWLMQEAVVRDGPLAGQPMWVADYQDSGFGAFRYVDRAQYEEGPVIYTDLNLLISPLYAWLYKETGDPQYRTWAQTIFSSGIELASLDWSGKIFNQNYRWSFDHVRWIREGAARWGGALGRDTLRHGQRERQG